VPFGKSKTVIASAVGFVTVTAAEPDFVVSCIELAVIVAVPEVDGVNTPVPLTLPTLAGLADHATAVLNFPVPVTVAEQVAV
jgi:hypothetical protein